MSRSLDPVGQFRLAARGSSEITRARNAREISTGAPHPIHGGGGVDHTNRGR
jgi:hypothetical protein